MNSFSNLASGRDVELSYIKNEHFNIKQLDILRTNSYLKEKKL